MLHTLIKKAGRSGFTLIELLVVIAIIGVLASIVLASLNNARVKARDTRRVADMKQIQLALEMSFDTLREYPATLAALSPTYMSKVPTDPTNANCGQGAGNYCYAYLTVSGSRTSFHLGALLEETNSPHLVNKASFNSSGVSGWTNGFNGTAAQIYDIRP